MALTNGTKLGPYEIVAPAGAGGMGEVYQARDTRLDRIVAIKVLPSVAGVTAESKARFEREARAISALQHPNICTLFDLGHEQGVSYLVMEFLEGETLSSRLQRGPIPAAELLHIAIDVAKALDRAHRSGIVHRDLKPGNIMLTRGGAKLLDFGLAKASTAAAAGSGSAPSYSAVATIDQPGSPITMKGTVVGTFQYMSPEQVEGHETDARSDIFSFGAVIYEMATGKRAFDGKTQLSVASAILEKEPESISTMQPMTPPALVRVVQRCLAKDPENRWQTARDLLLELEWVRESGSKAGVPALVSSRRKMREWSAWGALAIVVLVAGVAAMKWSRHTPRPKVLSTVSLPDGLMLIYEVQALSPDGTKMALIARYATGPRLLYVRDLASDSVRAIAGTDECTYPFWSPDSRQIAFFQGSSLRKVDANGGAVITLASAPNGRGGAWSPKGVIVFAARPSGGLSAVSESGGPATAVIDAPVATVTLRWPMFLPDGETLVYFGKPSALQGVPSANPGDSAGKAGLFEIKLGETKPKFLTVADTGASYDSGKLLFMQGTTLMSQAITDGGRLTGAPTPVQDNVDVDPDLSVGGFSTSRNGMLSFESGQSGSTSELDWYDRNGKKVGQVAAGDFRYFGPSLSPDRKKVAVVISGAASNDSELWVIDLALGTRERITFDKGSTTLGVWSRDGKYLYYQKGQDIYRIYSSGLGNPEKLVSDVLSTPTDVSPDNKKLAYMQFIVGSPRLYLYDIDSKREIPVINADYASGEAAFSPDGKWIAYVSEETGDSEIYVVPNGELTSKVRVSTATGSQPRWRKDGKELFYISDDADLVAAPVSTSGSFSVVGEPKVLFKTNITAPRRAYTQYDVSADGQRFLINTKGQEAKKTGLKLMTNWNGSW